MYYVLSFIGGAVVGFIYCYVKFRFLKAKADQSEYELLIADLEERLRNLRQPLP